MNLRDRIATAIANTIPLEERRGFTVSSLTEAVIAAIEPVYCYVDKGWEATVPWKELDQLLQDWPYDEIVEIGVLAALPNRFAVSLSNPPEGTSRTQTFATLDEAEAAAAASRAIDEEPR